MSNSKGMRFSDDFLFAIKERVNIIDLISATQPLKKAGKDHECCCPFHDEKSPSFKVSESEQLYHCFGCGESGDIFNWMVEYNKMSFPEAVTSLAGMAGLEVPKDKEQDDTQRKASSAAFNLGGALNKILRESASKSGKAVFSDTISSKYQVGLSDNGRYINGMLKKFSDNIDVSSLRPDKDSGKPGLAKEGGMTFPLTSRKGAVTGFVYFDQDLKPSAMGLHPQYNPDNQWLNQHNLSKDEKTFVLFDLKSLYQMDKNNDAATINTVLEPQSRTQISEHQFNSIYRSSSEVVFVLPNDRARASATLYSLIRHSSIESPVKVLPFSALSNLKDAKEQYLLDFTLKNWDRLDSKIEAHIDKALDSKGLSGVKNAALEHANNLNTSPHTPSR